MMFTLGQTVTAEQFYKFAPFGLEIINHKYRDCECCYEEDEDDDDAECCCGSGEHDIILRYSLSRFPPLTSAANIRSYESNFPAGLAPKPGFIWDSEESGLYPLMGAWDYVSREYTISKLPKLKLLKRKEI